MVWQWLLAENCQPSNLIQPSILIRKPTFGACGRAGRALLAQPPTGRNFSESSIAASCKAWSARGIGAAHNVNRHDHYGDRVLAAERFGQPYDRGAVPGPLLLRHRPLAASKTRTTLRQRRRCEVTNQPPPPPHCGYGTRAQFLS